jgi:hypothetical protein
MTNPIHALAATLAVCLGGGAACAQPVSGIPAPTTVSTESMQVLTDSAVNGPSRSMAQTDGGSPVGPTTVHVSSPPVPDTAANRAKYGQPLSKGGRHTQAAGN